MVQKDKEQNNSRVNLDSIMNGQVQEIQVSNDEEMQETKTVQGYCVECTDQPAVVFCEQCTDDYCEVCFAGQHRKGTRTKHTVKRLKPVETEEKKSLKASIMRVFSSKKSSSGTSLNELNDTETAEDFLNQIPRGSATVSDFVERSKFIPLRLTYEERKYLRLLEAGLNVCEYTDKIDVIVYGSKSKRIVMQIKELCSILSGLVLAADYNAGQELFKDRDFETNAEFFQDIFELGRRHKIMNPEKMRSTYGKLVYLLQDSQIREVQEMLSFQCVKPIKTVFNTLEAKGGLDVLKDELIEIATMEIIDEGKKRNEVQAEIRKKEKAIEYLAKKYGRQGLDPEIIRQCLTNRDPCEKMIYYLKKYFDPKSYEKDFSLAIQAGREGARLSHGHEKQYQYVLQSLSLWREVLHEDDLLEESNYYRLRDTGQGLNRVQAAPRVSRMMHTILHRAQQKVGSWVGSSVIHLGDHNVPNALMFIDKYTQIYRILLPIVNTLQKIDTLNQPSLGRYVEDAFHSHETAKKAILCDFFRHAFDGSGADNFFDAGSCIDGRLTSAWNWCSQLEKKPYFPLFLLTGFMGFDGQF
ncbi:hypothetical protein HK103_006159 [Boothiomyces macroporosus]|uniref:B box-type domain-containing protein n=1 Tax=Boothiomyces macroporosus TaxID=261099 RepID=A0AAD5Y7B1_9FUNG|nr:hypothetical protein HK103_006159 [Boothiomyces macroporosus]